MSAQAGLLIVILAAVISAAAAWVSSVFSRAFNDKDRDWK